MGRRSVSRSSSRGAPEASTSRDTPDQRLEPSRRSSTLRPDRTERGSSGSDASRAKASAFLIHSHSPRVGPLAAPAADQGEAAAQLVPEQVEEQLAALQALLHVFHRDPAAQVPDDHGARPVVPFGDDALEVGVLHRVVLHLHRQALLGRVEGGAARNRPGEQHPPPLQAQIEVELAGGVLLDREETRAPRAGAAEGLRAALRTALGAVGFQRLPIALAQLGLPGHRSLPR